MREMTGRQTEFWRRLCAPFDHKQRPGDRGRSLDYITARQVFNRLDDVCTPNGWLVKYTPGPQGVLAALSIECPGPGADDWVWITKEDGGGFAGMHDKDGDPNDDDFKSGFSDAIKRAAVVFGIGRYLYKDGVPYWLGEGQAPPHPAKTAYEPQRQTTARQPQSSPSSGKLRIPATARQVYPFLMGLGEKYGEDFVKRAQEYAKRNKYPWKMQEWDDAQVADVVARTVEAVKKRPDYDGCLDGASSGDSALSAAKAEMIRTLEGLIAQQKGRPATEAEVRQAYTDLSPNVAGKSGHMGEVLEDLSACTDVAWIRGITEEATRVFTIMASSSDDIPF